MNDHKSTPSAMVDRQRLQPIEDLRAWFPDVGFAGLDTFIVRDRGLFITDPIYLADVYNPNDDDAATYIRTNSVIVCDFGGDSSCPVWWRDPFLVLPLSLSLPEDLEAPDDAIVLADEIVCDSGSFAFIPLLDAVPQSLDRRIQKMIADRDGAHSLLPVGKYKVSYEQYDSPEDSRPGFHRNVVAQRQ